MDPVYRFPVKSWASKFRIQHRRELFRINTIKLLLLPTLSMKLIELFTHCIHLKLQLSTQNKVRVSPYIWGLEYTFNTRWVCCYITFNHKCIRIHQEPLRFRLIGSNLAESCTQWMYITRVVCTESSYMHLYWMIFNLSIWDRNSLTTFGLSRNSVPALSEHLTNYLYLFGE